MNAKVINVDCDSNEEYSDEIFKQKRKRITWLDSTRSLFIFNKDNPVRIIVKFIVDSKPFEIIILFAILASCVILAMNSQYPNKDTDILNQLIDKSEPYFLSLFMLESVLKIISYGFILHPKSYLRNIWNILDFLIVVTGLITLIVQSIGSETFDIKALRAFRVLRPLRLVSNLPSLQIVLNSIIIALKPLLKIFLLILILIVIYSIIGMSLFMGRLHATCYSNETYLEMQNPRPCRILKDPNPDLNYSGFLCPEGNLHNPPEGEVWNCVDLGKTNNLSKLRWKGPNFGITNFDNIITSMLTVFQIITMEGWTDIMYWMNDTLGKEWPWMYFITLVFLGSFFVLNLILGVLSGEFQKEKNRIDRRMNHIKQVTFKKEQEDFYHYKNWIEISEGLYTINYDTFQIAPKNFDVQDIQSNFGRDNKFKTQKSESDSRKSLGALFFTNDKENVLVTKINNLKESIKPVMKNRIYFIIIITLVFLNTFVLGLEYTNQPEWLNDFQEYANLFFVCLFGIEIFLKLFALGFKRYFSRLFNIFDFVVILLSIFEISLTLSQIMPQIGVSVLRCARLLRIFKLTPYWDSLRSLVAKMLISFKLVAGLLLLLLLCIVIFALLGMQVFGGRFNFDEKPRAHFDTFCQAFMTVFQILTGEDWNTEMYRGIEAFGGIYTVGGLLSLYYVALFIGGNYVLLNVFLAIVVENLNNDDEVESKNNDDNSDETTSLHDSNDSASQLKIDEEIEVPIPRDLVMVNGTPMLPAEIKNNIISMNKIKSKSRNISGKEQRVQLNIEEIAEEDDNLEAVEQSERVTYNDLYAEDEEELVDDEHHPVKPTMLPKASDFKKLKTTIDPIPQAKSLFILSDSNKFRVFCHTLVNHRVFTNFILMCIILSSLFLALEDPTNPKNPKNVALDKFDYGFLGVFTFELVLKVIVYGVIFHSGAFLRSPFNWIDLIVVVTGIADKLNSQDISSFRILRVFRVLRPLRAISRAKSLRHVIQCIIVAIKSMWVLVLVLFMLNYIFAVVAVQLFKGSFYSCTDWSVKTKDLCKGMFISYSIDGYYTPTVAKRVWSNNPLNYDNVIIGMLTLFTVSTFEGWPGLLYKSIDSVGENLGPLYNHRPIAFLFYMLYIVIIAFFMINLFVGFVIVTFQNEGNAEFKNSILDKNERSCIEYALKARPRMKHIPDSPWRFKAWVMVNTNAFENVIIILILLNTILLSIRYDMASKLFIDVFDYLNISFIILFSFEIFIKIAAFGFRNYFDDAMNIFDYIVVIGSYVDIVFSNDAIFGDTDSINLFRLFRVFRLFKLLMKEPTIRKLLWTFLKSFRTLPYVFAVIVLVFFIFATVGMQIFGKIASNNDNSFITDYNNFHNFENSILVLFRCVTGESWQEIMLSCIDPNKSKCITKVGTCGSDFAYIYFPLFIMLCSFLIMNLFVAIIMDSFEYLTSDNALLGPHNLEDFVELWSNYDNQASGHIWHGDLISLLCQLNPPLGFGSMCSQRRARLNLIRLNFPLQRDGTVLFNATMFALVRTTLGIIMPKTGPDPRSLNECNEELRSLLKSTWPSVSQPMIDQVLPSTKIEIVTIGKYYAVYIIQKHIRKRLAEMRQRNQEQNKIYSMTISNKLQNITESIIKNNAVMEVPQPVDISDELDIVEFDEVNRIESEIGDNSSAFWKNVRYVFSLPDELDKY